MLLAKIQKPFTAVINFLPDFAFGYRAQITFNGYIQPSRYDSSYDFTTPALNEDDKTILSFFCNNIEYEPAISLANCKATEQTFFWDNAAQALYVHGVHNQPIIGGNYNAGEVLLYSTKGIFYDSSNACYLPLLRSNVNITQEADRLVYGKISFVKNKLTFDNSNGDFDQFIDNQMKGSDCFLIDSETNENLYAGFVSANSLTKNQYSISADDIRSRWTTECLSQTFTGVNIEDEYLEEYIPEGYGDCIGIPATPTNGATTGTVDYKYATDGTSLSNVYVKIDGAWIEKTPTASDGTNCTFTLSAADGRDSSDNPRECKVNARLRDIDSPREIIQDMAYRYLDKPYTSEFFDITEWEAEGDTLADIRFYIAEPTPFFELLETIQNCSQYGFRVDVDAIGRLTMRVDNINRASSETIERFGIINDIVPAASDMQNFASDVTVRYDIDYTDDTAMSVINEDYKQDAFDEFLQFKSVSYDSGLKNSTDADTKAEALAIDLSKARNEITLELDYIRKTKMYEVLTINTRTYRYNSVIRDYIGDRKIKISRILYNPDVTKTQLTGYDITDIT